MDSITSSLDVHLGERRHQREELCGHSFSASAISGFNKKLDEELGRFARRELDCEYPYLKSALRLIRALAVEIHERWIEAQPVELSRLAILFGAVKLS